MTGYKSTACVSQDRSPCEAVKSVLRLFDELVKCDEDKNLERSPQGSGGHCHLINIFPNRYYKEITSCLEKFQPIYQKTCPVCQKNIINSCVNTSGFWKIWSRIRMSYPLKKRIWDWFDIGGQIKYVRSPYIKNFVKIPNTLAQEIPGACERFSNVWASLITKRTNPWLK